MTETTMIRVVFLFMCIISLIHKTQSQNGADVAYMHCCEYCRSEPKYWIALKGTFSLNSGNDVTKMQTPPAYMNNDEEEVPYILNEREYKLKYAGAPLKVVNEDLGTHATEILNSQYMEFDLASPKYVGGLQTQAGHYEEIYQGFYPYRNSWVTEFAISYSDDGASFSYYRDEFGNIEAFPGNFGPSGHKLTSLGRPIIARYVRYHPLKAQNDEGAVENVNVRVTLITCAENVCNTERVNCLMTDWTPWNECICTGTSGCKRERTRTVRRVQACGGSKCGNLKESETCTPPEPAWKVALQYVGIALGGILVILLIAFVIYKKTHKDRVEVIVVKENDDDDDDDYVPKPGERPHGLPPPGAFHPPPGAPPMAPSFQNMPRQPFAAGFGPRPPFGAPGGGPRFGGQSDLSPVSGQ